MDKVTIIGLVASILTSVSMLPQLIKIIKDKESDSVSVLMPVVLLIGLGVWIGYGILRKDWIIIGANAFSVIINSLNLFFTLKYRKKN